MNMHTQPHTTYTRTCGSLCRKHLTKALSDTYKHTLTKLIKNTTLKYLLTPFQISGNGQSIKTLIKQHLPISGTTRKSQILNSPAFSNSITTNTWVMLANNYSLDLSYIRPLRALYVIPRTLTHGPTYSSPIKIPTSMNFVLNATIK
jgi:hypothetical protein